MCAQNFFIYKNFFINTVSFCYCCGVYGPLCIKTNSKNQIHLFKSSNNFYETNVEEIVKLLSALDTKEISWI